MSLISAAFIAAQVWLELRIPEYMAELTMLVQLQASTDDIWRTGSWMIACAFGSLALAIVVGFLAAKIAAVFAGRLRLNIFRKVQTFSMGEINRFSTSSLITRSTNDVTQVQMIIAMGLQVIIRAPIMAVWATVRITGMHTPQWTAATRIALFFIAIVLFVLSVLVLPRFKKIQALTDKLNAATRENLIGLRVIRAFNAEGYQEKKSRAVNRELTENQMFTSRAISIMMPCLTLVMSGLTLAVFWIGAHLLDSAAETAELFANMIVFSAYAMQVVMSFVMMVFIFAMLPRVLVSAKRINEVLETETSIPDGPGVHFSEDGERGTVEFRNVSFKYPGAQSYVLRNISFRAQPGETLAFIGSTGSGKSTIVNLIPRFYDATEGQVLVNGVDVREYTLKQLRSRLGYIPQRAVIFSGTVASNVAFGDNGKGKADKDQIKRAVQLARGAEFVERMPDTYDSPIAQGGTNISGGQKQRISIARAICRDPDIFIFDDSFSALDFKTDKELRRSLKDELSGATRLIVAQRIGTIRDADKIVVLDKGELAGLGTHKELMRDCRVYREIAYSQLSEEELA